MTELEVLQQINIQLQDNETAINDVQSSIDELTTTSTSIDVMIDEMQLMREEISHIQTNTVIMIVVLFMIFFFSKLKTFGRSFK